MRLASILPCLFLPWLFLAAGHALAQSGPAPTSPIARTPPGAILPMPSSGPAVAPGAIRGAGELHVVTRYTPSPAVNEGVKRRFVAGLTKRDAKAAAAVETALRKEDFREIWAKNVAPDGLHPNDVADAMASYWVLNWLIAHGASENTTAQVQGTRRQVLARLSRDPAFRAMDDGRRQEMAEVLIYNFVLQSTAYQGATVRHDASQLRRLAAAAEARFRQEDGLDLQSLALTDQGLRPPGGSAGAVEPAGRLAPSAGLAGAPRQ